MNDYNRLYQHLNLKDKKDPRSIVNLVPSWFAKRLEVIPDEVFSTTEDDLRKRLNPYPREEKLRISFWQEYFRVSNMKKPTSINISNVVGGICDHRTFQAYISQSGYHLAFILMAPPEFNNELEFIANMGLKRMRDIMTLSPINAEGGLDKTVAELQLKIYQDAMNRRRGPISATSKNLHLHRHDGLPPGQQVPALEASPTVVYDIEDQIEQQQNESQILIEDTPAEIKQHAIHIESVEVLAHEPQEV